MGTFGAQPLDDTVGNRGYRGGVPDYGKRVPRSQCLLCHRYSSLGSPPGTPCLISCNLFCPKKHYKSSLHYALQKKSYCSLFRVFQWLKCPCHASKHFTYRRINTIRKGVRECFRSRTPFSGLNFSVNLQKSSLFAQGFTVETS